MAIEFSTASDRLTRELSKGSAKAAKYTRDGIAACVRFIGETGGIQGGRRKKGDEPAIPSTRQMIVNALLESGFCSSQSSACNFADIALAIVRGDIAGIDLGDASPAAAERMVRAELLPDATRVGDFTALVRGADVKAKNAKKGKKGKKAPAKRTNAEHFGAAMEAIRLMTEVTPEQEAELIEALASK